MEVLRPFGQYALTLQQMVGIASHLGPKRDLEASIFPTLTLFDLGVISRAFSATLTGFQMVSFGEIVTEGLYSGFSIFSSR